MNSFRVDELVLTFEELKPFSDALHDEMQLIRLHRMYKSIDRHDDDCLLRHVLCLVSLMENALRTDPPLIKSLQNNLIELTLLLEKAKSSASKNHIGIAMGILFKYSAALLHIQGNSDTQVAFILNSSAYRHLCSVSSKDVLVSAWIAMHLLEVAASINCSDVAKTQVSHLWRREDLAEYCVDTLIPSEGCIQLLHSGVFRDGIENCSSCWPTITVKEIQNLFNRILPVLHRQEILRLLVWMIRHDGTFQRMTLFDDVLDKSLGAKSDLNSVTLTSLDVKVFLFTLLLWSDSSSHPAAIPGRLRIKVDHINCWSAVCQLISSAPHSGNLKSVLMLSRVMDSVRLRYRVISLRRLYEVFRWLEANVGDNSWLTLYATTISDGIARVHSYRRKCDEVFPDGTETDVEFTVDEVDRIEEHVARYLASQLLTKKEFGEAERRLVYASSAESRNLLIKVSCEKDVSPNVPLLSSEPGLAHDGETISPLVERSKVLVDVYTNTPNRASNWSALSSVGNDNESFFSLKSDGAVASDRSFASAIASPLAVDPHHKVLKETNNVCLRTHGSKIEEKMASEQRDVNPTAIGNLAKSNNLSLTNATQVVFSGNVENLALNNAEKCNPSELSAFSQTGSSGVVTNNGFTLGNTSGSKSSGSSKHATLSKPVFGQIIDKEAATSFWKGKSGISALGGHQRDATAADSTEAFGQHDLKNVAPTPHMPNTSTKPISTLFGNSPTSVPYQQLFSPSSGFVCQRNKDCEEGNLPNASMPGVSQKSHSFDLTSSDYVVEDYQNEDESFYNNLLIELCQRRIDGKSKKTEPDSPNMEALQKKMAQIEKQIQNTGSQLHMNTKVSPVDLSNILTPSTPTASELRRKTQHETLLELEKKVAQLMDSASIRPKSVSSYRPETTETVSSKPLNSISNEVACADPMSLFRGLLNSSSKTAEGSNLSEPLTEAVGTNLVKSQAEAVGSTRATLNVVLHPGNSGICLGCMDDDEQDRALRILERLANEWNTGNDCDSD